MNRSIFGIAMLAAVSLATGASAATFTLKDGSTVEVDETGHARFLREGSTTVVVSRCTADKTKCDVLDVKTTFSPAVLDHVPAAIAGGLSVWPALHSIRPATSNTQVYNDSYSGGAKATSIFDDSYRPTTIFDSGSVPPPIVPPPVPGGKG